MSPTQRALAHCRTNGWVAEVVEKWNAHSMNRNDLFGFADLLVLGSGGGSPMAVQVTSGSHHADRRTKILAEPRAELWCRSGCRIEIWSFDKRGDKGKRKIWSIRTEAVESDDFGQGDDYDACRRRVLDHLEALRVAKAERRRLKREAKAATNP